MGDILNQECNVEDCGDKFDDTVHALREIVRSFIATIQDQIKTYSRQKSIAISIHANQLEN